MKRSKLAAALAALLMLFSLGVQVLAEAPDSIMMLKKESEILWYYELYYQNPDGSFIRWKIAQGGWTAPDKQVAISHESFDGEDLGWGEILGVHYAFDEDNPNNRLTALAGEATRNNPLKIYYECMPHTVTYQYEGDVPPGVKPPAQVASWYSAEVTLAEVSAPAGYVFAGWRVELPIEGTEIEDGKIMMPNADVILIGTWEKLPAITLTGQPVEAYTGGTSLSGDSFPTVRYHIEAPDGADVDGLTFTAEDGEVFQAQPAGEYHVLPGLANIFTQKIRAAAENDALAGAYDIGTADSLTARAADGTEYPVVFTGGAELTVRYVSNPQDVLDGRQDLASPVRSAEDEVQPGARLATAVIPSGAQFYTNGKSSGLGLVGTAEAGPQISLLFDDILGRGAVVSGADTTQMLIRHAEQAAGVGFEAGLYEFKYLDLVNEHDGNAWVSTDSDITVFWPYPKGVKAEGEGYIFRLLHFTGLHRDYEVSSAQEMQALVDACTVEEVAVEKTPKGLKFTLPGNAEAGSFSPFALVWQKAEAETPASTPAPAPAGQKPTPTTGV